MIVYLDTSGFIPLVIQEAGSEIALRVWAEATEVVSSRLVVVEASAALSMAARLGRIPQDRIGAIVHAADTLTREMNLVDASADVIDAAAALTRAHLLRGYDAMHLATAELMRGDELVFVSGDRRLLGVARDRGLATVDSSGERLRPLE